MSSNIFLRALDAAVGAVAGAPEMANRPPRTQPTIEGPRHDEPSGFRAVSQNGTLDGVEQSAPLSARARAELQPKVLPRPEPDQLAGTLWPSPAQVAAFDKLLAARGYRAPSGLAEKLTQLDAPWMRLQAAIGEAASSSNRRYFDHLEDLAKRVSAGDSTARGMDGWTRTDWSEDSMERLRALKAECKKIEREAWAVAAPALCEKADFADAVSDELEAEAQPIYDALATPFTPPLYVWLLRKYAASLRDGSRATRGKPSTMISEL